MIYYSTENKEIGELNTANSTDLGAWVNAGECLLKNGLCGIGEQVKVLHTITYQVTYTVTYPVTYAITYPATYPATYAVTYAVTYPVTYQVTYTVTYAETHKFGKTR